MDLITRLIAHWRSQGIICPGGASLDEMDAFQVQHNIIFPSDMREYLLAVNGMGGHEWDDDFFSFWSLADIRSISADLPDRSARFAESSKYFLFADHSIFLPAFAIRLTADAKETNPVVCVVADSGLLEVSPAFDSFTDFISAYLNDPVSASLGMRAQTGQKWKSDEMKGTP